MQFASAAELASLALPAAALQGVSSDDQNKVLQRASAMLASRMGPKWVPPFVSWGDDLRGYTADVAGWLLIKRRGVNADDPAIGVAAKAYDDALKWADDVGAGTIIPIDLVDSTPTEDDGSPEVSTETPRGWGLNGRIG